MNSGKIIFALRRLWTIYQSIHSCLLQTGRRCVQRYKGKYKVKQFTCYDPYLCAAFAPLTYRESLGDIEACLRAQQSKLYHMGIRCCKTPYTIRPQRQYTVLYTHNERQDTRCQYA